MAYKGSTGGSMNMGSIKPYHLRKKKKAYASYGAHLAGPIKVTKADGTVEIQDKLTAAEINQIVHKQKRKYMPNTVFTNPNNSKKRATAKQKAYMTNLGIKFTDDIKRDEASRLITDFLKNKATK